MLDCLAVALGGAIGSVLRYLIGLFPLKEQTLFPIKTFAINVLGCFVIGLIAALSLKSSNLNPRLVLFLKVGICGGFTTFSTFALESSNLLKNGHPGIAALYMFLSIAVGIGFVLLAELLIKNRDKNGKYQGVGAHLFVIACKLSWDVGNEDFVQFKAKTDLVEHYRETLNAKNIDAQNMYIDSYAALNLIKTYFSKEA